MIAREKYLYCAFLLLSFGVIADAGDNPLWNTVKSVPAQPDKNDGESDLDYGERINSLRRAALIDYIKGADGQTGLLSAQLESGALTMAFTS